MALTASSWRMHSCHTLSYILCEKLCSAHLHQQKGTKMKNKISQMLVVVLSALAVVAGLKAAPPPVPDVGDPDTFGHNAQYMGVASGFVQLMAACPAPTPPPTPPLNPNDSQCFHLGPAPAAPSFDAQDIARIKLPKKATRNIIYPVVNIFLNY